MAHVMQDFFAPTDRVLVLQWTWRQISRSGAFVQKDIIAPEALLSHVHVPRDPTRIPQGRPCAMYVQKLTSAAAKACFHLGPAQWPTIAHKDRLLQCRVQVVRIAAHLC